MAKQCYKCTLTKPLEDFHFKSKDRTKRSDLCKVCQNEYVKGHYQLKKKKYLAKAQERRIRYTQLIRDLKESKPCMDCKQKYPACVMDFDHRDPSKKKGTISIMVSKSGIDKTLAEIKKCDLVCSNCHRIRTDNRLRQNSARLGIEPR